MIDGSFTEQQIQAGALRGLLPPEDYDSPFTVSSKYKLVSH